MKKNVSVIVITFNGFSYIDACVASIKNNPYADKEIIVVDNGSSDGTGEKLKSKYPDITVIFLPHNIGPAAARNEGLQHANGDYIMFLDNDTIIDKGAIKEAVTIFKQNTTIGIIQCKLLFKHDSTLIDCTGEYIGQWGFLVHRKEVGEKDDVADSPEIIFSAKSAGMFIRKRVLDSIGHFDPDYFIYLEETDLAWRVWMAGYKALYLPQSIVYHESGSSSVILSKYTHDYNVKFHGCKNYILTLIKNAQVKELITILPIHILLWLGLSYFSLAKGYLYPFLWIHKAIIWNVVNIRKTLHKRTIIQSKRIISDKQIFKNVMKKKLIGYYLAKVLPKKRIGNSEGFFKTYES